MRYTIRFIGCHHVSPQREKTQGVRNVPGPIKEEREIREGKAKNKKGGTGKWERVEKPQTTRSR